MTHCLSFLAWINQLKDFMRVGITPTVDGVKGVYIDKENGQFYEVVVKPIEVKRLQCRLCREWRPAGEITGNAGNCAFCALGVKGS